jgi:hypothetical protein
VPMSGSTRCCTASGRRDTILRTGRSHRVTGGRCGGKGTISALPVPYQRRSRPARVRLAEDRFDPGQSVGEFVIAVPGQRGRARVPDVKLERAAHGGTCVACRGTGRLCRVEFPACRCPDHMPGAPALALGGECHDGVGGTGHLVKRAGQRMRRRGQDGAGGNRPERGCPVAWRICCWCTYRSMYSRATSSQTGAGSEPVAHCAGPQQRRGPAWPGALRSEGPPG